MNSQGEIKPRPGWARVEVECSGVNQQVVQLYNELLTTVVSIHVCRETPRAGGLCLQQGRDREGGWTVPDSIGASCQAELM